MKNYADRGGCYPPQPSASADNTLLDLHNSSYHTRPHPIIAKYFAISVQLFYLFIYLFILFVCTYLCICSVILIKVCNVNNLVSFLNINKWWSPN